MSRYNDNAPIGHTCPIIDNVIGKMETAKNEAEYLLKQTDIDVNEEANSILGEMIDTIKEIQTKPELYTLLPTVRIINHKI